MSSSITKKTLEHIINLARIELTEKEGEKLLKDLQKILDHFEELKELDTKNVEPMTGGTRLKTITRDDTTRENTNRGAGTDAFPKSKKGFLEVPPVFSAEGGSPPEADGPLAHAPGGE